MNSVEITPETVLSEFQKRTGAQPLIPLFQEITDQDTLRAERLHDRIKTDGEKGWRTVYYDILVADSNDPVRATAALRDLGQGLALFVVAGSSQDLLGHHSDLLTKPPIYNEGFSQSGVKDACWDCNLKLWTVISAPWDSQPLSINFFPGQTSAGTARMSWLVDILQKTNSSSSVSPSVRG
jgi:hypothetical protein